MNLYLQCLFSCRRPQNSVHVKKSVVRDVEEKRRSYDCKFCAKSFNTCNKRYAHTQRHHKDTSIKCQDCDRILANRQTYKEHWLTIHLPEDQRMHECWYCVKRFGDKNRLNLHIRTVHKVSNTFPCDQCDKTFIYPNLLAKHVKLDHEGKGYICFPCNKIFRTSNYLNCHFTTVHDANRGDYKCPHCQKVYLASKSFQRHMKEHEFGRIVYVCDTCGKQLSSKTSLRDHMRIHTGEKPLSCKLCDKKFKSRNEVRIHYVTHTKEKKHVCTVCNKSFTQRGTLTIHMRNHTGERPYSCDICEQKFTCKSLLTAHSKIHGTPVTGLLLPDVE